MLLLRLKSSKVTDSCESASTSGSIPVPVNPQFERSHTFKFEHVPITGPTVLRNSSPRLLPDKSISVTTSGLRAPTNFSAILPSNLLFDTLNCATLLNFSITSEIDENCSLVNPVFSKLIPSSSSRPGIPFTIAATTAFVIGLFEISKNGADAAFKIPTKRESGRSPVSVQCLT